MLQSINPTAQRSQQWIMSALLELMEITEYDKITVSQICQKAELDRRTFYRNFDSKYDVLKQYTRLLGEEYMKMYATAEETTKYTAAKIFFEFWSRHLYFIRNIKKCGLSDFVFQQFENFTRQHYELLVDGDTLNVPLEYAFTYRIGGYWNVMITWALKDVLLPPEEMAVILSQI